MQDTHLGNFETSKAELQANRGGGAKVGVGPEKDQVFHPRLPGPASRQGVELRWLPECDHCGGGK